MTSHYSSSIQAFFISYLVIILLASRYCSWNVWTVFLNCPDIIPQIIKYYSSNIQRFYFKPPRVFFSKHPSILPHTFKQYSQLSKYYIIKRLLLEVHNFIWYHSLLWPHYLNGHLTNYISQQGGLFLLKFLSVSGLYGQTKPGFYYSCFRCLFCVYNGLVQADIKTVLWNVQL